jgi:hypothetical protein
MTEFAAAQIADGSAGWARDLVPVRIPAGGLFDIYDIDFVTS